jgi:hypothetical protein
MFILTDYDFMDNNLEEINNKADGNINRNYKSSTFCSVFSDEKVVAELVYALTGIKYHPDAIRINTLFNVLCMSIINDFFFYDKQQIINSY